MSEPKSFASLGPTLLARKGGAKPAMRPQAPSFSNAQLAQDIEDLGWNDMGSDDEEENGHDADILPLTPPPLHSDASDEASASDEEYSEFGVEEEYEESELDEDYDGDYDEPEMVEEDTVSSLVENYQVSSPLEAPVEPEIVGLQRRLDESVNAVEPAPKPSNDVSRKRAVDQGRRAAFTLRLDSERHLKLRLASTVKNCSAQQLVTEALDRFLNEIPEIHALAAQVKR